MATYAEVEPLMPPDIGDPREGLPKQVVRALEDILTSYSTVASASYLNLSQEQRAGHVCESLAVIHGWLNGIDEPVRWMRMRLGLHRQMARATSPKAEANDCPTASATPGLAKP